MKILLIFFLVVSAISIGQEPFKENGLYGLKDESGEVLVKPEYKELTCIWSDNGYLYKGFKNKEWYLISDNEELKTGPYDEIEEVPLMENLLYCVTDNTMDVLSLTDFNYVAERIRADYIEPNYLLEDDILTIHLANKQGLFNLRTGDVLLAPEYDEIIFNDFSDHEDLTYIGVNEKMYSIISSKGEVIFDQIPYEIVGAEFYDSTNVGITIYSSKYKEGYISLQDEYVIKPKYDLVMPSSDESSFATTIGKKGEGICWNGSEVLKPKFDATFVSEDPDYVGEVIIKDITYLVSYDGSLTEKR